MPDDEKTPVCGDCKRCTVVMISWDHLPIDSEDANVRPWMMRDACIRDPYHPVLVHSANQACKGFVG